MQFLQHISCQLLNFLSMHLRALSVIPFNPFLKGVLDPSCCHRITACTKSAPEWENLSWVSLGFFFLHHFYHPTAIFSLGWYFKLLFMAIYSTMYHGLWGFGDKQQPTLGNLTEFQQILPFVNPFMTLSRALTLCKISFFNYTKNEFIKNHSHTIFH